MHAFWLGLADEDRIEAEPEEIVPQRLETRLVEPATFLDLAPRQANVSAVVTVCVAERDEHAVDSRKALLPGRVLDDHGDDVPALHDRASPTARAQAAR